MAPRIREPVTSLSSCNDMFERTRVTVPHYEKKIKSTQRVSFSAMATVYKVKSLKNYTAKEIKACWYDYNEECENKRNVLSDAKLAEAGRLDPSIPYRGLESRTKQGLKQKIQNRIETYSAVFDEIEYQKRENIIDEEYLADIYFEHSEPCAVVARMLGKSDEIEAFRIHQE